ncbi:hypothetical protein ACFQ1M_14080 [Sungkyunkwania multivorans]|uniref:Uncharacterized protein n=1 Tax=Sungkyunkwania multivorans TaxID=1173618 RepID=A0ABW3CZS9_9FLAO
MNGKNFIISQGNRPWWQLIIAAFFFTGSLIILYYILSHVPLNKTSEQRHLLDGFKILVLCLTLGIGFSVVKDVHIDLDKGYYRNLYSVGPFKYGTWKPIKRIEYISVFNQIKEDGNYDLEVNLWYDTNKHLNLFVMYDIYEALTLGKELAAKLNTKLLDATIPNDYKWVED